MTIIDKLFKDKKKTGGIYILLAVGILLLICGKTNIHNAPTENEEIFKKSTSLEERTEEILGEIAGVGKVSVMIFAPDETMQTSGVAQKTQTTDTESVLVVADGADNAAVREKIVRALKSALGVESHKIEVFERKESQ